jgi:hypothetical protein
MRKLLFVITLASALFGQSNYPGSLDNNASLFVSADNVQTTVANAVGIADTTVVISTTNCSLTACGFVANMIATICDSSATVSTGATKCTAWENMLVTAVGANTLTVTRGLNGTSARTHASGAIISNLITSGNDKVVKSALVAIETTLGPNGSNLPKVTAFNVQTYNFAAQTPGGSLASGANTITMSPVPLGVNGTDTGHFLYVSGGTGTAEACLINGGSGTSGQASGSITINCANTHSGAWNIRSATAGAGEAAQAAGTGGSIYYPPGTYAVYGPLVVPFNGQTYFGDDSNLVTITPPNSTGFPLVSDGNVLVSALFFVVGGRSDVTLRNIGLDGNFANQTYPAGKLNTAIAAANSVRLKVIGSRFHAFGYSSSTDAGLAQVISLYSAQDCQIRDNLFLSNLAYEVNMNGTQGCNVTGNTFGSPNIAEAQTNVNWWDSYSGGFGTLSIGSSNIFFAHNRTFGSARSYNGGSLNAFGYLITNGGGWAQQNNVKIQNNEFHGLGNSRGTVSVTNGSGTITGSNTQWVAGDVNRRFMVEGDTNLYTITGFTSVTQITVSPTIARATGSNLRFQYQHSGDVISVAPVTDLEITGNAVYDSGDMAYDLGSISPYNSQHVLFANNIAARSQVAGLFIGGANFDLQITSNLFINNGRKQLSGHQGAIEISPTNQGATAAQSMWHMTFTGNQFLDDQATTTQLYAFQLETGQSAHIFDSTLGPGNHCFAYQAGCALFDPSSTAAIQSAVFRWTSISGPQQFIPTVFADLANMNSALLVNGMITYCSDCTVAATCAGAGTGAFAKRLNNVWVCN